MITAPAERVYAALVDPEALTAWLPPDGMSGTFERFDCAPGRVVSVGAHLRRRVGRAGEGHADSDIVEARFVELVPGARVVQAVDFVSDDPAYAGTMTMTWAVSAVDGGTCVDFTADDVPDGISAEDHAAGLASSLYQPRCLPGATTHRARVTRGSPEERRQHTTEHEPGAESRNDVERVVRADIDAPDHHEQRQEERDPHPHAGRSGATRQAAAATRMTWPDGKLGPFAGTSFPRRTAPGSLVPGR